MMKAYKYPGVSYNTTAEEWRVRITIKGKQKYLGCYYNELDALEAHRRALILKDGIEVRVLAEYFYNLDYEKPGSYYKMKRVLKKLDIPVVNARIDAEDISKLLRVML